MGVPMTTGQLRTNIKDMEIGDYIKVGHLSSLGWLTNYGTVEFSLTGTSNSTISQYSGYYYYLIKIAKGLLCADRVVLHSVSWDILNSQKVVQGLPYKLYNSDNSVALSCTYRSLTGGCAYADENGNMSKTDKGFGGFPTNNEWDKYIVNFPQDKIQEGKTLDDVFHWSNANTYCQETWVNGVVLNGNNMNNTWRMSRGVTIWGTGTSGISSTSGFRPVFEYDESKL